MLYLPVLALMLSLYLGLYLGLCHSCTCACVVLYLRLYQACTHHLPGPTRHCTRCQLVATLPNLTLATTLGKHTKIYQVNMIVACACAFALWLQRVCCVSSWAVLGLYLTSTMYLGCARAAPGLCQLHLPCACPWCMASMGAAPGFKL